MNSKPGQLAALAVIAAVVVWAVYSQFQYFNGSFLGALLLVEVLGACMWKFETRFFPFLMIAFVWAGMNVPMQGTWTSGRWVQCLLPGPSRACVAWIKNPQSHFKSIHLLAVFCVTTAFVSASVSSYVQMASLKALSLLLLFVYGCSGARLAALGRERRFFEGLVSSACEIVTFATAICYFALGQSIWGNPKVPLGAAMSIGIFPVLLWGWLITDGPLCKARRLVGLVLCAYLIYFGIALGPGSDRHDCGYRGLLFLPAPVQGVSQGSRIRDLPCRDQWYGGARFVTQNPYQSRGRHPLQGTQGGGPDGVAENTVAGFHRFHRRTSPVRNRLRYKPNRRRPWPLLRAVFLQPGNRSGARKQLHDHRRMGRHFRRCTVRLALANQSF